MPSGPRAEQLSASSTTIRVFHTAWVISGGAGVAPRASGSPRIADELFPDHPIVAIRLNNLAELLRDTNRLSGAEPLYRRAVGILVHFARATGHQHPHFETVRANYAEALTALGRSEAEVEAALRRTTFFHALRLFQFPFFL
jgi:hypothetical protein